MFDFSLTPPKQQQQQNKKKQPPAGCVLTCLAVLRQPSSGRSARTRAVVGLFRAVWAVWAAALGVHGPRLLPGLPGTLPPAAPRALAPFRAFGRCVCTEESGG
eukprot:3765832-Rhodomonas_salina.1